MMTKRSTIRLALGAAALFLNAGVAFAQTGVGGAALADAARPPADIPPPPPPPAARLIDSFGLLPSNDTKARLDNYGIELQNDPGSTGLIVSYADRACRTTMVRAKENMMRTYLVSTRGLERSRLAVQDGGRRQNIAFELWLIPRNDARPRPTPTLSPCKPPRPARRRRR